VTAPLTAVAEPLHDCPLCARLVAYRLDNRAENPGWFNGPVPSFGSTAARLLIVGLAPGVRGANRTGRPFTGDHAGILLYETLLAHGFAHGAYEARPDDDMTLRDCRIVNAVRCVPPANRPLPAEITTCNRFLAAALAEMPRLRVVLSLGVVSHDAVLKALGLRRSGLRFMHGAVHELGGRSAGLLLADSYHVSRYNTSTRRLTPQMFEHVIGRVAEILR
jgi:uracil-DNA glycosylase family 4